jgi:hypothetical protein
VAGAGCLQSRSLEVHDHGFFISGPAVVEILDENQRMCMDSDFFQWGLSPANGTINRRGSRSTLSSVSFSKKSHWTGCPQRKSFFSTRSGRSFTGSAALGIFWWYVPLDSPGAKVRAACLSHVEGTPCSQQHERECPPFRRVPSRRHHRGLLPQPKFSHRVDRSPNDPRELAGWFHR